MTLADRIGPDHAFWQQIDKAHELLWWGQQRTEQRAQKMVTAILVWLCTNEGAVGLGNFRIVSILTPHDLLTRFLERKEAFGLNWVLQMTAGPVQVRL